MKNRLSEQTDSRIASADPTVSIVMPVFNRNHLVQRAIDSVFAQTCRDWELLIIDDGSTDGLHERILPLVMQNQAVRYFKHANRKLSASRNIGIQAALGEFITFIDSDDEYHPNHLARRIDYMRAHLEVDVVYGGVELIGPPHTHYVDDAFNPGHKIHLSECTIGATFFGRRSAFLVTGGFKIMAYSAESEYLPRLQHSFRVERVGFPTYRYHTGLPDSICAQRLQKSGSSGELKSR